MLWYQELLISMVLIICLNLWYAMRSACDIYNFWYHSSTISQWPISLISSHLCCWLVLYGLARSSVRVLPCSSQRIGDGYPDEWRQTWSSTWTCCSECCQWASSESAGSCSSSCLCNLKLHWVKFKLKHHTQAGSGPAVCDLIEQPPSNSQL
jgi:hypothetical protein